jgi:hypothetical protein
VVCSGKRCKRGGVKGNRTREGTEGPGTETSEGEVQLLRFWVVEEVGEKTESMGDESSVHGEALTERGEDGGETAELLEVERAERVLDSDGDYDRKKEKIGPSA